MPISLCHAHIPVSLPYPLDLYNVRGLAGARDYWALLVKGFIMGKHWRGFEQRGVIWWDLCVVVWIDTLGVKGRRGRPGGGGNCNDPCESAV